jgi:hypothetical protein
LIVGVCQFQFYQRAVGVVLWNPGTSSSWEGSRQRENEAQLGLIVRWQYLWAGNGKWLVLTDHDLGRDVSGRGAAFVPNVVSDICAVLIGDMVDPEAGMPLPITRKDLQDGLLGLACFSGLLFSRAPREIIRNLQFCKQLFVGLPRSIPNRRG